MAEKRKPVYTMLLKKESNKKANKVEIFSATDWKGAKQPGDRNDPANMYRLRVNGKWFPYEPGKRVYYKTEIFKILMRSINFR